VRRVDGRRAQIAAATPSVTTSPVAPLSLTRLTKYYGATLGVEDITFDIQPGQVMGFVGPNGSGKTTVIRMLTGLIGITRGDARMMGARVGIDNPEARRLLGYLPGSLGLYDNLTARQYFSFLAEMRSTQCLGRALSIAERLGLDPDRRIGSMSKGTRQKVGVVQAFMHRPRVIILDEPTSGLDPLVQREFVGLLHESRDDGAAMLLSSHVMHEVESIATHVTIILKGRQVLVDDMARLRTRVQRTLTFEFERDAGDISFDRCPHVVGCRTEGATVTCTVVGPETDALALAVRHGVVTVTSSEPSLEDLFYSVTEGSNVR